MNVELELPFAMAAVVATVMNVLLTQLRCLSVDVTPDPGPQVRD